MAPASYRRPQLSRTITSFLVLLTGCWGTLHSPPLLSLPLGNDFQRLSPSSSGIDFIGTESSFPTHPQTLIIGTTVDYARSVLPVIQEDGIALSPSLDDLTSSHFHAAWGIAEDAEIHLRFPFVLHSASLDHPSDKGHIGSPGLTYIGGGGKYRFARRGHYEFALAAELGADLMRSNPYVGADTSISTALFLACTADYSPIILGINAGYKYRTTSAPIVHENEVPISPIPHILLFSSAITIQSQNAGNVIAEVYSTYAPTYSSSNRSDRSAVGLEVLLGYSKLFAIGLGIKAGVGAELLRGPGTAKWRIFAGADYLIDIQNPFQSQDGTSVPEESESIDMPSF